MLNNLLQKHWNCFKKVIQKTGEAASDLIGDTIGDKNTKVSKTSPRNKSETNEEILIEIYIYLEEREKIDDLRLV